MTVPKQRRTKEHRRDRAKQYAVTLKNLAANGAQSHRITAKNSTYKGRDYSSLFTKKKDV